jgi:amyloid beta precursor protein binding protein 1
LHNPWPSLKEFVDSIDMQNADDVTHRHIPYGAHTAGPSRVFCAALPAADSAGRLWVAAKSHVRRGWAAVLLIKAVERWRAEHDSTLPKTSNEKASFRNMLKSWQRQIDGIPLEVCCLYFHIS